MSMHLSWSDVELRLIDVARNRFRIYGLTVCRTLFGEPCLRVVWGRIGQRPLRERSETFADFGALEEQRVALLKRRHKHGYVPIGIDWATLLERRGAPAEPREPAARAATEREIVEAHGLSVSDRMARALVEQWHAATRELRSYVAARGEGELDLEDVSTLAAMYVQVCQVA